MKALSVKQPLSNLIASGQKTIEMRTWRTAYRGDLLVVSSKVPKIEPAGYAFAIVRLVDCRPMTMEDEGAACLGCTHERTLGCHPSRRRYSHPRRPKKDRSDPCRYQLLGVLSSSAKTAASSVS